MTYLNLALDYNQESKDMEQIKFSECLERKIHGTKFSKEIIKYFELDKN